MQNLINRFFLLFLLSAHTLFGCALCTLYSPETRVSLEINADENYIKEVKVLWVLTKEFTQQLKDVYDLNQDLQIDKTEMPPIEQALIDYVKPKNFLTHISYDKIINEDKSKKIDVKSYKTYIKNSLLHFEYIIKLNYKIAKDNIFYININDDQNYFILLMVKNAIKFNAPFKFDEVINRQSAAFYINLSDKPKTDNMVQQEDNKGIVNVKNGEDSSKETLLSTYSKKLKSYLVKIEKGDNVALLMLLLISFVYGIIHALGPGHGKSLAFSYFVANKSSFTKAFFISQASAFVHIIGALILVVFSVFILESILNNFVKDSVEILTKVSAVLIMILAVYILYNKFNNKECSCSSCSSSNPTWSSEAPNKAIKLKPNFVKKDLYFVLTAGLIPCPGTVILFIYAFILKTYFAVFLASIFISLGMGLVIFASSFLGVSLNKVSSKSHEITNFLQIAAPVVMFVLGLLLFLNANLV